jgi:hypothetical protein
LVVPTGPSVQTNNADSRLKFQLTVALAPYRAPAEASNTVYLIDEYGFAAPECTTSLGHDCVAPQSRLIARA